jgi:hypothetical protein
MSMSTITGQDKKSNCGHLCIWYNYMIEYLAYGKTLFLAQENN